MAAARYDGPVPEPGPWVYGVEFIRTLVVAAVMAGIACTPGSDQASVGIALGLALWLGFPLVLWVGAIVHEGTRVSLAVIHAGDWIFKLVIIGAIVGMLG